MNTILIVFSRMYGDREKSRLLRAKFELLELLQKRARGSMVNLGYHTQRARRVMETWLPSDL